MKQYTPHPWHFIFPVIFIFLGAKCYTYENEILTWTGLALIFSGAGSYLMILINGTLPRYTEYWKEINSFVIPMSKTNNPDLWRAMGFEVSNSTSVNIKNNDEIFPTYEQRKFPVSDSVLELIAEGISQGKKFSEGEWVVRSRILSSANFRELQKNFREQGFIQYTNRNHPQQGYSFTKKGGDFLKKYLIQKHEFKLQLVKTR